MNVLLNLVVIFILNRIQMVGKCKYNMLKSERLKYLKAFFEVCEEKVQGPIHL